MNKEETIKKAYEYFNARNIDAVLALMQPDVTWPRAWEGDYVSGHHAVRDYWTKQWKELNPIVTPVSFKEIKDGKLEVGVHQLVKNLQGEILIDGTVKHIYTMQGDLIKGMEIEKG